MEKLLPFSPHSGAFAVFGSLSLAGGKIRLKYELRDPKLEIAGAPQAGIYEGGSLARADGLWQSTCFEAFWGEEGADSYWELNISPSGRLWNLYRFEKYRVPQPPVASDDFVLERISVRGGLVDCVLSPKVPLKKIEASLCAVLKAGNDTHYFALAHSGGKADFHLRSSFCLRAG